MNITELSNLVNQSHTITGPTETFINSLQSMQTTLRELGEGLLKRQIVLKDNPDLTDLLSELNSLIGVAPGDSVTAHTYFAQLKDAAGALNIEYNDPELPEALELIGTNYAAAKEMKESAHLLKEGFRDLNAFENQLDLISPTADETAFFTLYRDHIDRYLLLSNYIDLISGNYLTHIGNLFNLVDQLLNDPRNKIQSFGDHLPFALLPVRVETRFMTIKHVQNNIAYSSVADVFRTNQDAQDIKTIQQNNALIGTSTPHAGGTLTSVSAGQQIPDRHELWVRIYPDDIAIHTHENLLSQNELNSAQIYWIENWKALSNANLKLGAWRVLCGAYGPERAAWIVKQTTPTNGPNPNTGTPPLTTLTTPPILPTLTLRPASWSNKPQSKVMPDRFVVRVYDSNNTPREVMGNSIPSPLPVGFDPMDPYSNYLNQSGAEINMPPELRWLTNFEEAEKIGMGIRIPLQGNEKTAGFKRLLVLGLKLSLNATGASSALEELMNNHHYAAGLALVPQGTPTNNTSDDKSGFVSLEPGHEESFATEVGNSLFTATTNHYNKADGQRLAEALGINNSVFEHVANSNTYDVKEAMAMTRALWPATMGYYLKNMLSPSIVGPQIDDTRTFFTDYVLGRGLIPAFRVKNQPYGVLPATVYSRWKYSDQFSYESKLYDGVLMKLSSYWENVLVPQVEHISAVTPSGDPDAQLANILGLNPSSVEYYQRTSIGNFLASNMTQFIPAANQPSLTTPIYVQTAEQMLDQLYENPPFGFNYFSNPRIFSMAFQANHRLLKGPVIDTLPLSESRTVENVGAGNANYLQWLSQSSMYNIRHEIYTNIGAAQGQLPPQALLYLLLRHAWFHGHLETSHCLLSAIGAVSVDAWHNHELLKMTEENGPDFATVEQKEMLFGFVRSEVVYENELLIEDRMRNIQSDPEFLESEMTPAAFHQFLRDSSLTQVEQTTSERYDQRLRDYTVEQSQWHYLISTFESVTGPLSMEDYLYDQSVAGNPCIDKLLDMRNALDVLKTLPTARLERCLSEHLDTCTYRLDAWINGLVSKRLDEQRTATPSGIYLGAFGILENPRPNNDFPGIHVVNVSVAEDSWNAAISKTGSRKILAGTMPGTFPQYNSSMYIIPIGDEDQPGSFVYIGDDSSTLLIEDPESGAVVPEQRENPDNQGFILAPSLNHAVAAAILRAGYVAHQSISTGNPEMMAVALTSARVRTALFYLEGIRNGQSLGALLGYRLERGIHDAPVTTPLDGYIHELRAEYPLVAESVVPTSGGSNGDAQTNHVIDGLQVLERFKRTTAPFWYTGIPGLDLATTGTLVQADHNAILAVINKIKDDLDAIGDLLLAEAIFQVSRGNHARAGSVLKALGYGAAVPEPEIIKTPRKADTFTHRCVVQLQPAPVANGSWNGSSIRAATEPNLNNWLATQLPDPTTILVEVNYTDTSNSATQSTISIDDLDLQPIDLIMLFGTSGSDLQQDASELSRRIIYYVQQNPSMAGRDDLPVTINYRSRSLLSSSDRTIFEMLPVFKSLLKIVGDSRALDPEDFLVPGLADNIITNNQGNGLALTNLVTRLTDPSNSALFSLLSIVNALFDSGTTSSPNATEFSLLDALVFPIGTGDIAKFTAIRSRLISAASFGIQGAIPELAIDFSEDARDMLLEQASRVYKEAKKRYDEASLKLTSLPTEPKAKFAALAEIAKIIFGRTFRVFPEFTVYDSAEVSNSIGYSNLLNQAGPFAVEEWMHSVSRVRPRMGEYHKQMLLSERIVQSATRPFATQQVLQFPVVDLTATQGDRWIGAELPSGYQIPNDAISMVVEYHTAVATTPTCGMIIDEWTEQIPVDNITTGVAVNYDQPSSEAPQSILLATTPEIKGSWSWDDLMDTLNETVEMAKKRAVDSDLIRESELCQVLPALVMQMNGGSAASPALDFARNNVQAPPGIDSPIILTSYPDGGLNSNNLNT